MAALTETEARDRSGLLDVWSYDVFLDLSAEPAGPARSRTEIRFGCRKPGAATFAELTATATSAVLNGRAVDPAAGGRLGLPGLAAENVLVVEAEVAEDVLTRFTDPADGAGYLLFMGYPTLAPGVFCCFDQADLTATSTLSLALPGGWDVLANGPVRERPPAGQPGVWRFGPVSGTRPFDLTIAAGPYVEDWRGEGGTARPVRMSVWRRRSLAGLEAGLARFAELAQQALEYYERTLGVPCPYPKYDIGFVPRLDTLAVSFPGLMLVNESLLARMPDPDDDFVAMVCAHACCGRWPPAGSPPTRTWTPCPPRTRWAGSRTGPPAARCGLTRRPRRRPGRWRWAAARTGGWRWRPRAGSGWPARKGCSAGIASGTSPRRWRRSTAGRSGSCGSWPGRCTRPRSWRTPRWRRPRPRWSAAR